MKDTRAEFMSGYLDDVGLGDTVPRLIEQVRRLNLGLRLGNEELRIAVGLRLGAPLVRAHRCVCRAEVGQDGHHGLACRRSAGRHKRHALANVIVRAIWLIVVRAELEPARLLRDYLKRPDGATLDPWGRGKYLVWDFTCPDTQAPSHLNRSSTAAGS